MGSLTRTYIYQPTGSHEGHINDTIVRVEEPRGIENEERQQVMWSAAEYTRLPHRPAVPRRWKVTQRPSDICRELCGVGIR